MLPRPPVGRAGGQHRRRVRRLRGKTRPEYFDVAAGVAAGLEFSACRWCSRPADNAGAPSDNTTILRHLIERRVENAAVGPIWDPVAVRVCFDAGLGAHFPLRFGGKIGPTAR